MTQEPRCIIIIIDEKINVIKFKIRLTSKTTGKKIDLNIIFDHKYEKGYEVYKDPDDWANGDPL